MYFLKDLYILTWYKDKKNHGVTISMASLIYCDESISHSRSDARSKMKHDIVYIRISRRCNLIEPKKLKNQASYHYRYISNDVVTAARSVNS